MHTPTPMPALPLQGVRMSELALRPLPRYVSAPLAGAMCGLIAFKFPQVSVARCGWVVGWVWLGGCRRKMLAGGHAARDACGLIAFQVPAGG